jgi:hypothetical protein
MSAQLLSMDVHSRGSQDRVIGEEKGEEAETDQTRPDGTYDLGILLLLRTIRPQHGFSLINSHTSPLNDLKVFQAGYNLAFNPGNQLETDRTFGAYEKVTPTEYSTPSLIVTARQLLNVHALVS